MVGHRAALLGATILTSTMTLGAGPAQAQEFDLADTFLGRIVLGAGAREGVAIDTPQAVTVVNEDEIDRAQATTVGELFDFVPGLQAIGGGRVGGESFNMRGIGGGLSSDESRILVTVDGAIKFYEQYRLGSFFSDPALYRRVEVLRGPASSTLYGAGALGGVINFETRDPSDFLQNSDSALRTRLTYGSNADERTASVIFATRHSETWESLASLSFREANAYTDGAGQAVAGSEFGSVSGLVKTRLGFGNDQEQALTFSYARYDSDNDDAILDQVTGSSFFGTVDRRIIDQTYAITYENAFPDSDLFDLSVTLNYSDTSNEQENGSLGGSCRPGFMGVLCPSSYAYETVSLQVENVSEFSGANYEAYVTAGLQLSRQDRVGLNQTTPGGAPTAMSFHPEGTDEKIGLYVQGEFIFNENLTIVPGLRVDRVSLESAQPVLSGVAVESSTETLVSPKLAVHYQIDDTYAVFGSVAQTERAPTLDERFTVSRGAYSPNLMPETATSAELGFAASYAGVFGAADALDIKATAFYFDVENYIERGRASPYRNVDAAEIYGLEIEGAYVSDNMFVRAAYSDVRGKDATTGQTLSSIAPRNLSLSVGGRDEQRGLEYGWQGAFYDDIDYGGGNQHSGYAVHDLFVDWSPQQGSMQGFEVGLRVNNVFDTEYRNALMNSNGEGRSYEVSLTRNFEF